MLSIGWNRPTSSDLSERGPFPPNLSRVRELKKALSSWLAAWTLIRSLFASEREATLQYRPSPGLWASSGSRFEPFRVAGAPAKSRTAPNSQATPLCEVGANPRGRSGKRSYRKPVIGSLGLPMSSRSTCMDFRPTRRLCHCPLGHLKHRCGATRRCTLSSDSKRTPDGRVDLPSRPSLHKAPAPFSGSEAYADDNGCRRSVLIHNREAALPLIGPLLPLRQIPSGSTRGAGALDGRGRRLLLRCPNRGPVRDSR